MTSPELEAPNHDAEVRAAWHQRYHNFRLARHDRTPNAMRAGDLILTLAVLTLLVYFGYLLMTAIF